MSELTPEEKALLAGADVPKGLVVEEAQRKAQAETGDHQLSDDEKQAVAKLEAAATPQDAPAKPRAAKRKAKFTETGQDQSGDEDEKGEEPRGNATPVQYDDGDNGWGGTPVQMRG